MKRYLFAVFFIFMTGFLIAGCDKSEAQTEQKSLVQSAGPQIHGKILYSWTGFKEKPYGERRGVCIFSNGRIEQKLSDISYAIWMDKEKVMGYARNDDRNRINNTLELIDVNTKAIVKSSQIPRGIGFYEIFSDGEKLLGHIQEQKEKKYTSNLAIYDFLTEELKKITKFPVGSDWSILGFDLSPDESKIAYSYGRTNELKRKIEIVDISGNEIEELPIESAKSPAWSPDGKKLVFTASYHNDKSGLSDIEITLYDVETKEITRLTHHEGIASTPDFSPDGKQIVYVLWGDGGRANNLAVININGTGFKTLLPEEHIRQGQVSNPDWGP